MTSRFGVQLLLAAMLAWHLSAAATASPSGSNGRSATRISLSVSVPRTTYPRNALVPITVVLANHSGWAVHLPQACGEHNPTAYVTDGQGHPVYAVDLPGQPSAPAICRSPTDEIIPPGGNKVERLLVVLRGRTIVASSYLMDGTRVAAHTLVSLTPSAPTPVTVHRGAQPYAVVTRPAGAAGRLYYQFTERCRIPGQQVDVVIADRDGWLTTRGTTVQSQVSRGCTTVRQWKVVAGWMGMPVASWQLAQ